MLPVPRDELLRVGEIHDGLPSGEDRVHAGEVEPGESAHGAAPAVGTHQPGRPDRAARGLDRHAAGVGVEPGERDSPAHLRAELRRPRREDRLQIALADDPGAEELLSGPRRLEPVDADADPGEVADEDLGTLTRRDGWELGDRPEPHEGGLLDGGQQAT